MGVYTYSVGGNFGTPFGPGTGLFGGSMIAPPGIWTAAQVRVQGIINPNTFNGTGTVEYSIGGSAYDVLANVVYAGGNFDTGFYNAGNCLGAINTHLGKSITGQGFMSGGFSSSQLTAVTFQLTGTPAGGPAGVVSPILRLMQIAPNLFFEVPEYPPLDLQPEAGPITYPGVDYGPGAYTDVFSPFGTGEGGRRARAPETDRVRGRKNVACLRRKGGAYINIGGAATQIVPAVMQVSLPGDAQWLKFTPGLANFAASASNGNVGIRVYAGLSQFALGKWTTGYTPIPVAPDWVGNGSFTDLFAWERPLQFFVEIIGLTTPIPAASLFEFRFDGFDLG